MITKIWRLRKPGGCVCVMCNASAKKMRKKRKFAYFQSEEGKYKYTNLCCYCDRRCLVCPCVWCVYMCVKVVYDVNCTLWRGTYQTNRGEFAISRQNYFYDTKYIFTYKFDWCRRYEIIIIISGIIRWTEWFHRLVLFLIISQFVRHCFTMKKTKCRRRRRRRRRSSRWKWWKINKYELRKSSSRIWHHRSIFIVIDWSLSCWCCDCCCGCDGGNDGGRVLVYILIKIELY